LAMLSLLPGSWLGLLLRIWCFFTFEDVPSFLSCWMKAAEGPCDHVMFCRMLQPRCWLFFDFLGFGSGVDSSLYFRGFYIGSASLKTSPPGRSTPVRKRVQTLECEKVEKKKTSVFRDVDAAAYFAGVILTLKCKIYVDCRRSTCGWRFFLRGLSGRRIPTFPLVLLYKVLPTWVAIYQRLGVLLFS
jgi:hypothetical protein